jgi:hypothetical protein
MLWLHGFLLSWGLFSGWLEWFGFRDADELSAIGKDHISRYLEILPWQAFSIPLVSDNVAKPPFRLLPDRVGEKDTP